MRMKIAALIALLLVRGMLVWAQSDVQEMTLWPNGAPGTLGDRSAD